MSTILRVAWAVPLTMTVSMLASDISMVGIGTVAVTSTMLTPAPSSVVTVKNPGALAGSAPDGVPM